MSGVAIASTYHNNAMLPHGNDVAASPQAQRKPANRPRRNVDAQSDSNIPNTSTPKPKSQRQRQQGDRAASENVHASSQRTRQASASTANPLLQTPAKTAYAGPTFHASPAPSALPVPRFFSRSVPSAGPDVGLQSRMDKELEGETLGASSDVEKPQLATQLRQQQHSPLDIFFKADRDERAKRQSSSNLHPQDAMTPDRHHFRPDSPGETRSMLSPQQPPRGLQMEQGDPDSPVARRALAPNSTRPGTRRMQSAGSMASTSDAPVHSAEEAERDAFTKSLKSLLKVQPQPSSDMPPNSHAALSPQPKPAYAQSPQHRNSPAPSTPQHPSFIQPENSLHYGNRNLSPIFHAARIESPTRSSALRHQLDSPSQQQFYQSHPQMQNSPSGIAQAHLQQQQQQHPYAQPNAPYYPYHQGPVSPGPEQRHPVHYSGVPHDQQRFVPQQHQQQDYQQQAQQYTQQYAQQQQQQAPRQNGSNNGPDVKGMEEKLRGMLKLNGL